MPHKHAHGCIILWLVVFVLLVLFINSLGPRRNGQHFADDIFKRIFFNENVWISIQISLQFVPKGPNAQFAVAYMRHAASMS